MHTVNIAQKFSQFNELWSPKVLGEINDSYIKAVKVAGELVVKGQLRMKFRDHEELVRPGEFIIVPRGVEHLPVSDEETQVLLFEPKSTLNTGNVTNERTLAQLETL
jgi:hypothetical protein